MQLSAHDHWDRFKADGAYPMPTWALVEMVRLAQEEELARLRRIRDEYAAEGAHPYLGAYRDAVDEFGRRRQREIADVIRSGQKASPKWQAYLARCAARRAAHG